MKINKQELIAHIYRNGTLAYSYEYDDLGQLTRENNTDTNRTYVYTYDTTGNILSKKVYGYTTDKTISTTLKETHTYYYGKTDWNDLLQGYNGVNFSHDDIGNPLSYNNGSPYTFTWKQGRRLQEAITGGVTYTYTYNDEGIRTAKMFDYNNDGIVEVTHYYHLAGSQILSEEWTDTSEVTHLLVYNYDADGTIMGLSYRNSTYDVQRFESYLFIKNIQGDILHIYDENGNKVVSYLYDAWGNITSTTGSMASTVGKMNPFRYRGYYYDEELGFYYLNSRYYDPKIGRFINADNIEFLGADGSPLSYNLFAYCSNNPVMGYDPTGNIWFNYKWTGGQDVAKKRLKKFKIAVKKARNKITTVVAGVWEDLNKISFNPFNTNENDVLESNYVSFYKGSLVIRHNIPNITSFGISGMIMLNKAEDETVTVKHEYGHNVQQALMGGSLGGYLLLVGIPSAIYCQWGDYQKESGAESDRMYYSKIWERTADWLGGVNRNNYDPFWTVDNFLCW